MDLDCTPFGCRYGPPLTTFPDIHNTLRRRDVQAKYMLEGWAGEAKAYVPAEFDLNQLVSAQYGYLKQDIILKV